MRRNGWFVLWVVLMGTPWAAAADTWIEVRSPNFRVICNDSEQNARNVARGFEQMKAVIPRVLLNVKTDSPRPTVIIVLRGDNSLTRLVPNLSRAAGFFTRGPDKSYAVVRLDYQNSALISYHEYVHQVMDLNFERLPLWLNEGLAEFFANSRFENERVLVGTPTQQIRLLRGPRLVDLKDLLAANHDSPAYRDDHRTLTLYAECWALTHYLFFGEGMGRGQKMGEYLRALKNNENPAAAFARSFGDVGDVERNFYPYLKMPAYYSFAVATKVDIDAGEFTARKMSGTEADAEIEGLRELLRPAKK